MKRRKTTRSQSITGRDTPSKTTTKKTENSEDSIPIDLIIEILSRLSVKSVAKCRCVSKLWSSILRRLNFTELFLTRSQTRPQLLFACRKQREFLFLSAPQPQNPDVNSSPVLSTNRLMHFPFNHESCEISRGPFHGLVCILDKQILKGRKETVPVICNPSTGQSLTLPKVKTRRLGVASYLGYDPIDRKFKVLCMTWTSYAGNRVFDEFQVLTIGNGKNMSWRMIKGFIPPHYSYDRGICIDGVLYYRAGIDKFSKLSMIVCFDFKSEKFNFIIVAEDSIRLVSEGNLIYYNGKLGSLVCDMHGYVDGREDRRGSIELWVMEDAGKMEWSNRKYVLPVLWQNELGINLLHFVGVTRTNEIVFSPMEPMSFCVFNYNIERNTIIKVGIQGMEALEDIEEVYLDHIEDVKLM